MCIASFYNDWHSNRIAVYTCIEEGSKSIFLSPNPDFDASLENFNLIFLPNFFSYESIRLIENSYECIIHNRWPQVSLFDLVILEN